VQTWQEGRAGVEPAGTMDSEPAVERVAKMPRRRGDQRTSLAGQPRRGAPLRDALFEALLRVSGRCRWIVLSTTSVARPILRFACHPFREAELRTRHDGAELRHEDGLKQRSTRYWPEALRALPLSYSLHDLRGRPVGFEPTTTGAENHVLQTGSRSLYRTQNDSTKGSRELAAKPIRSSVSAARRNGPLTGPLVSERLRRHSLAGRPASLP